MQTRFKWMATDDGGAHLFTDALHLVVSPRAGGGWVWIVYNSGHYRALRQSSTPAADLATAKAQCKRAAINLLINERVSLEEVEVK